MHQNQSRDTTSRDIHWTLKAVFEQQEEFWTLNSVGSCWVIAAYPRNAALTRKTHTLKHLLPSTDS